MKISSWLHALVHWLLLVCQLIAYWWFSWLLVVPSWLLDPSWLHELVHWLLLVCQLIAYWWFSWLPVVPSWLHELVHWVLVLSWLLVPAGCISQLIAWTSLVVTCFLQYPFKRDHVDSVDQRSIWKVVNDNTRMFMWVHHVQIYH